MTRVRLELSSARAGEWHITSDGTYLVGFSGPQARELAVRHQQELDQLLNKADPNTPEVEETSPQRFTTTK